MTTDAALRADDGEAIDALREALGRAGFADAPTTDPMAAARLGTAPEPGYMPVVLHALRDDASAQATLTKLFVLEQPVPVEQAAAALAPLAIDRAEAIGVLAVDGISARAWVCLTPVDGLVVANDFSLPGSVDVPPDLVMGGSVSTWNLVNATIRRPVRSALDVGTGNGVQALLAARHADQVTATDINRRAIDFARFNARLNGFANVDVLEGSFFEPVGDRRFDLIVSNAPFVVSPDSTYLFRDAGLARDELGRMLVQEAAARLDDGGTAHLELSWVHAKSGDWTAPVAEWVDGLGCDVWLLRFGVDDAVDYAVTWNSHLLPRRDDHAAAVLRWIDYFEEEAIEAISYGIVTLRRREGRNWMRTDTSTTSRIGRADDHAERVLAAADFLDGLPDAAGLLDQALRINPKHRLDQVAHHDGSRLHVDASRLILDDGVVLSANLDTFAVELLATFDGSRTLRESIALAAAARGLPATALGDIEAKALPMVEQMVRMAVVLPA